MKKCDPSVVSDDWVTKGMHIHIGSVELNIYTNRNGEIEFRSVFTGTRQADVNDAIRTARNVCLPNPEVRNRWITRLEMARIYMLGYEGHLESLANGRMFEFKLIRIAIERWENDGTT